MLSSSFEADRSADELGETVAMAMIRPALHRPRLRAWACRSRMCSARFLPVTIPSLAERVCTSMAIRLAHTTTLQQLIAEGGAGLDIGRKLPGSI